MHEPVIHCFPQHPFLSNMYLLYTEESLAKQHALVIDPSRPELLIPALQERGITHLLILLTHEHFDHTVGINPVRAEFDTVLLCQEQAAARMLDPRNNRPLSVLFPDSRADRPAFTPYTCQADETFAETLCLEWFGLELYAVHLPGHSPGSCCITVSDSVFTGDSLLPDLPTITRFPAGDPAAYQNLVLPYLMQMPPDRMIYPGHGDHFRFGDAVFSGGCFCIRKGASPNHE